MRVIRFNVVLLLAFFVVSAISADALTLTINPQNDTFIDQQNPLLSWGATDHMLINEQSGNVRNPMLIFNLSNQTANVTNYTSGAVHYSVTNAIVYMYMYNNFDGGSIDSTFYNVTQPWNEQVNWANQSAYAEIVSNNTPLDAVKWYGWNVTVIVKKWFNGTAPNNGVLLGGSNIYGREFGFYSREFAVPASRPYIVITYQINTAPYPPVLNNHTNYTSGNTNVSWAASVDNDSDPLTYNIRVGTSSGADNVLNITGLTNLTSPTFAITQNSSYFYSAMACDIYNNCSGWSSEKVFWAALQNLSIVSPTNASTTSSNNVNIIWNQYPNNINYAYKLCSDYNCINIVSTGTGTIYDFMGNYSTGSLTLALGTTYYFNVSDASGNYTTSEFTTPAVVVTPGQLNITAKNEQIINQTILNFYVQLYNSTAQLNKSTTTGWVNFSGSEVSAGQYLIRVVPNSSYASRSVLATSPANVTVYLPATSGNTIDLISFFLYDYTNQFPWQTSIITVTKNNLIMHQSYFDGDTGAPVYLIRGDVYGITITNGNNIQNWGNYQSTAPANVQIALSGIQVNASKYVPFAYNITEVNGTTPAITLQWSGLYSYMTSLNFTIQNSSRATVHQLITSVQNGQSIYLVTNVSDIYYIYFSANTNDGYINSSFSYDYRTGGQLPDSGFKTHLSWGTFTLPSWVTTLCVLIVVIILAGTFGAIYAPLGGLINVFWLIVASKWGWISNTTAAGGFLAGLTILTLFSFIKDRDYEASPSMYAYKSAMFLMYCNAGISLVNAGGLVSGVWVSTYNTHNIIFDIVSKVGIFSTDQNGVVMGVATFSILVLSLGVLALSTFGLFALTLPAMALVFGFSTLISGSYIYSLNLSPEWVFALSSGLVIVNLVGFMQYMGMSSMKLKE